MKAVVFDLETLKLSSEVGGFGNCDKMGVAMIGAWRSDTAMYKIWDGKDFIDFIEWLNWADVIIGYNILNFDYKVLRPYFNIDEVLRNKTSIDLMEIVKSSSGGKYKSLNKICLDTLNIGKTEGIEGSMAPQLYKEGKIHKLMSYLLDDVQLTVKLFFHIAEYKEFKYKEETYKLKEDINVIVKRSSQLTFDF